jgi:hypothetical protein
MLLDSAEYGLRWHRFDEIGIGSRQSRFEAINNTIVPRDHDDYRVGKGGAGFEIADYLVTIHIGEFDIQKYKIWYRFLFLMEKMAQGRYPIIECDNLIAFPLQARFYDLPHRLRIIYYCD